MKLDETFAREVRKTANGDGTREARFAFLREAEAAARELSTIDAPRNFTDAIRNHGRAAVALCVAATAIARLDRLQPRTVQWALEVAALWTNRPPSGLSRLIIDDGLHPTRLDEYAGDLIRVTSLDT